MADRPPYASTCLPVQALGPAWSQLAVTLRPQPQSGERQFKYCLLACRRAVAALHEEIPVYDPGDLLGFFEEFMGAVGL
jgi:hypothetical protein